MVKQQLIFDLRTFVANSTLSRLRAFGGHFWPKSGGRGHANILYDRGIKDLFGPIFLFHMISLLS